MWTSIQGSNKIKAYFRKETDSRDGHFTERAALDKGTFPIYGVSSWLPAHLSSLSEEVH